MTDYDEMARKVLYDYSLDGKTKPLFPQIFTVDERQAALKKLAEFIEAALRRAAADERSRILENVCTKCRKKILG